MAIDYLSDEFYEARREELRGRVKPRRFEHSEGVAATAVELASIYGVDERKARIAGILHDWDKGYEGEGILERVEELGLEVDPFVATYLPRVLHAETAALALSREYPDMPSDITQAIARHTIAAVDMSPLDCVLYCADALEPNRTTRHMSERIDELRALPGTMGLEELFFTVYRHWILLMLERDLVLHPCTIDVYNTYIQRFGTRKDDWK